MKIRDGGRADYLKNVPEIAYSRITEEDVLRNQFIRLSTIYKIVNKDGSLTDFTMNKEQYDFYRNQHNLNLILKSRQRGFTTVIQLMLLDIALFTPNTSCGIIAHTKEDAAVFFDKKIKLAYENIPADFKRKYVPSAEQDREGQLKFSNGSTIRVGTSMRSDTLQHLHVSEFGKLCAKFPDKADEVVSGALNTVSVGNHVTIESTGEGAYGHFFDMCQTARSRENAELTPMEYKFFFYPWWTAPEYTLEQYVEPQAEDIKYFKELETSSGITLTLNQMNWYCAKRKEQQDRMWREYPSTPDEAFRGIIDGAPLSRAMSALRRKGQITRVPYVSSAPVVTFWDLGHNDSTAIWFMQRVGFQNRFIDYYETNLQSLAHYAAVLKDRSRDMGYIYDEHYLPHDVEVTDISQTEADTRKEVLESLGVKPIVVVPRISAEEHGVNAVRNVIDTCWFDSERCEQGIKCLENVRYHFDAKLQAFKPKLMRTWAKHGYDAFAQFGHGYRHRTPPYQEQEQRRIGIPRRGKEKQDSVDWRI